MIQGTAANAGRVSRSPVAGDAFGDSNLTESQLLMWIEQKLYSRAPLYNVAMTFTIEGALNHSRMQEAFARIVAESDALRTVIEEVQGNPQQRVLPYVPFDVDFVDFTTDGATEDTLEVWLAARCRRPFELDKRLFDAALIKLASERFVWYQCQHHLISDGWSTALIYRRLMTMYERLDGGDVAAAQSWASFQDYVASERTLRKSPEYKRAEQYWREKLAEPLVPVTFYGNAPSEKGLQKERVVVDLGLERSRKLMAIARQEDIFFKTPNVTLLNIFNTLLLAISTESPAIVVWLSARCFTVGRRR